MGYRLSKEQQKSLAEGIDKMKASRDFVEDGLSELNRGIQQLVDDFNGTAVERYNQDLETFTAVVGEVADDARDWHDDHGEAWLNGEKGEASGEFVCAWEEARDGFSKLENVQADAIDLDLEEWADEIMKALPTESE